MIIKSISWKQGVRSDHFAALLSYINKGVECKNTPIFHNLMVNSDDIRIIAKEFLENARYSPKRKNGVECYHEILSFREGKTSEDFEDIAREYLRLRAPNALAYGKLHQDTEHPHIHFCISGNQIKQKAKNRLSHAEFRSVKVKLKKYVKERYPELLPKTKKTAQKEQPFLPPRQQPGQTIKAELSTKILSTFETIKNPAEAFSTLEKSGIEVYGRGKVEFYGVVYQGKKYRLSTLGIKEGVTYHLNVYERTKTRLQSLQLIQKAKAKIKEFSLQRERSDWPR